MCGGGSSPPTPQAPPPPTPQRDTVIEAREKSQQLAKRAAGAGYASTMQSNGSSLINSGSTDTQGLGSDENVSKATLGG